MMGTDLLACIWSGAVEPREEDERSPLATLLDGILTVPTVSLVAHAGLSGPVAFADSVELLPGIQLGDVLAEELGFDVPVNSVILLEPAALADATEVSATELGRDLGRVLTSVAEAAVAQDESVAEPVTLSDRSQDLAVADVAPLAS
ncbi:hypothetical protein [Aestuariivita sp.]|uniref:hypothetical protein n=1 Tax=Aestuariivita sp. TaxID=1872407 RepID=UPI0021711423|nr:hypothetical protein [Aestuariivita sp.]MCE8008955.1 hypothetical protein [Aestuariivita sp.]